MDIGILGGMGSIATLGAFENYLNVFKAEKEWDRPRIIIDNNCTMPSRVRAILYNENRPALIEQMTKSIQFLITAGCTDIILACNTSHVFLPEIIKNHPEFSKYIHNIIDNTINEVSNIITKDNVKDKKVYLLATEGTILSNVYQDNSKNIKIECNKSDFTIVREFIEAVKTNNITDDTLEHFAKFVNNLPCENVILGCTELPVLYHKVKKKITKTVFDPIDITLKILNNKFKNQQ